MELSDFLQVSLGVLGTLEDLIIMFLLYYFGDVLQLSLTGEVREEGEGEQEEDVDSSHQPGWLEQSAGTELPTIGSPVPRLEQRYGGPELLLRCWNQPGGGDSATELSLNIC